jgi:hypothetical protein
MFVLSARRTAYSLSVGSNAGYNGTARVLKCLLCCRVPVLLGWVGSVSASMRTRASVFVLFFIKTRSFHIAPGILVSGQVCWVRWILGCLLTVELRVSGCTGPREPHGNGSLV